MQRALKYSAGLIALYLLVAHSTGTGRLISGGSRGAGSLVESFQGRSKISTGTK